MEIKSIQIKGNKRFSVSKIKQLTYTPVRTKQLIVGQNGAGKSTLLSELNPLPSNIKKDYVEGGFKVIEILHNGSSYTVTSGKKYSFIKDGTELNTAGNRRVQLELVKEHFNLTPYLLSIVNGTREFTTMGPNERKDWFAKISHTDFTTPLDIYTDFKKRETELRGAISVLKLKLSSTPPVEESIITNLTNDVLDAKQLIDSMLSFKVNVHSELYSSENNTIKLMKELKGLLSNIPDVTVDHSELLTSKKAILEHLTKEMGTINIEKGIDIEALSKRIEENKLYLNNVRTTLSKYTDEDPQKTEMYLSTILSWLSGITNDLEDYDAYVSLPTMQELRNNLEGIKLKHEGISKQRSETQHKLSHYTTLGEKEDVICPKCSFGFKPGYNKTEHDNLSLLLTKQNGEYLKTEKELKVLQDHIRIKEKFDTVINTVKNTLTPYKWLYDLFAPISLSEYTSILNNLLQVKSAITGYSERLSGYKEDITLIDKLTATRDFEKLTKEYDEVQSEVLLLTEKQNKYLEYTRYKTEIKSRYKNLLKELYLHGKDKKNEEARNLNLLLDTQIGNIREYLSYKEVELNKHIANKTMIAVRVKEIKELEDSYSEVKRILVALSPNNGIIAKYIFKDLTDIINDMNSIVNSFWEYRLEVLPTGVEDGKLTYKFPVMLDHGNETEDVQGLSSSQKEIINLAFRIVSMHRLGMSDYPFLLDEFARTFDPLHRQKAYDVINMIADNFKQVFIVSHFESSIPALKADTDINVITKGYYESDSNNIKTE